ncbi:hypothetical protein QAD02_021123 [Eretmocerus hayati]|uniref:Uncharacterized protein n=1 Tax=Eretmocerus hayati TaxID=131215 RepID=A0ACC2PNY5_9HYME|nr:hypothetical protein QAD02_021123 [Eretmocerus hayati]
MAIPSCIFVCAKVDEEVHLLDAVKFAYIRDTRKSSSEAEKWKKIELPRILDRSAGYHTSCYEEYKKSVPVCVFGCTSVQDVILFTEDKLESCKKTLAIRQRFELKYKETRLPSTVDDSHGYHASCLKNFSSLKRTYRDMFEREASLVQQSGVDGGETSSEMSMPSGSAPAEDPCVPSSSTEPEPSSSTDQQENVNLNVSNGEGDTTVCIICNQPRKRANSSGYMTMHSSSEASLKGNLLQAAALEDDEEMVQKVEILTEDAVINYHNPCKTGYLRNYLKEYGKNAKHPPSNWRVSRDAHANASRKIIEYVKEKVVDQKMSLMVDILIDVYVESYNNCLDDDEEMPAVKPGVLIQKLMNGLMNEIQIVTFNKKKIVAPRDGCIINQETFSKLQENESIIKCALALRRLILSTPINKLPSDIKVDDLLKGECQVPHELSEFLKCLICGRDTKNKESSRYIRKANYCAQDIIYAVHRGKVLPSKHIKLGLTLKSLTSSRRAIDVLNGYGHIPSYTVLVGLETEATFSCSGKSNICPDDIVLRPDLGTGVAYNNFDRNIETQSGNDTMHDTVGIIYQNVVESDTDSEDDENAVQETPGRTARRRRFESNVLQIAEYNRHVTYHKTFIPPDSPLRVVESNIFYSARIFDNLFMMAHYAEIPNTPMWVGYESLRIEDTSPKQKVSYLKPINASPTNKAIVLKTLEMSQEIATECSMPCIQVTYDLAIYKVALRIQCTESPRFDNVFVHSGAFHIYMLYFRAIGKYTEDCGLIHLMVESGLLASGSVNGFLQGKHYNRCKRLHPIVALALQLLHFESFLATSDIDLPDDFAGILMSFQGEQLPDRILESELLCEILEKYESYTDKTLQGEHGKTAQFYATYIKFVQNYHMMSRSIRTGNIQMYKAMLLKLSSIMYSFNQTNYCRWLLVYHDNLLRVADSNPSLELDLQKGLFGIKRTDKPFSRGPVDQTLEQTYNADAAKRLKSVSHFTNSISARER